MTNSVFFEGLGQSSREEFSNPGDAVSLSFLCYNNRAVGMKPMLVKPLPGTRPGGRNNANLTSLRPSPL